MQTNTNRAIPSEISAANIRPRLCLLHKWSHYDGYGIHLICNENWCGLQIDEIELNSPAESAGLLRGDIILAVNGRSIENEDFFAILSFLEYQLKKDQIRFLVLDASSVALTQRYRINIDENYQNCIRKETTRLTVNANKFNQTMLHNSADQIVDGMDKISNRLIENPSDCSKLEPRMCSITLCPGSEPIGISLQADADFSHIITQVQSNSPAAHAGIEQDDCILSLNDTPLLHVSFEDVLYFLAKTRSEAKLDFLVAKKSYLLQSFRNHLESDTPDHLISSVRPVERNRASTLPLSEAPKRIKYQSPYKQRLGKIQRRELMRNDEYDRLSLQLYSKVNISKQKRRHGNILKSVGPGTALRLSSSATSEKTIHHSSSHSDLLDMDGMKEHHNTPTDARILLQVGLTNPSPRQRIPRLSTHFTSVSFSDDERCTNRTPSSVGRLCHSPETTDTPNLVLKGNHVVNTPSTRLKYDSMIRSSPTLRIGKPG